MKKFENVKPHNKEVVAGRFAPSPTGDLHFGSLLAAVASYSEARSKKALWHLRIDDIDIPRSVPGSAERIQKSLLKYGLHWDGEVQRQSERDDRYRQALSQLIDLGLVFSCGCSRRSLPASQIYPGTCRANRVGSIDEPIVDRALRLVLPDSINFFDAVQGKQTIALSTDVGDVVIWRRDKLVSYTLACAIDDAVDCNEVVRGADLLPSTAAQIAVMRYLSLDVPSYAHIPVAVDANNDKLSKHSKASPIDSMDTVRMLHRAWNFLGQPAFTANSVDQFWSAAIALWQIQFVPHALRMEDTTDE